VIGVGYDGTGASARALELAVELAVPNGAALRVYAIAQKYPQVPGAAAASSPPAAPTEAAALNGLLHEAVRDLPDEVRALPVFLRGFPAPELLRQTEAGVDLLVLGSRAGGPVRRMLHHSVTAAVIEGARCPVLIAPAGVTAAVPAPA
jgi:nucleotide-binding universal stress UspA family protein